jgi:hypothetical protein
MRAQAAGAIVVKVKAEMSSARVVGVVVVFGTLDYKRSWIDHSPTLKKYVYCILWNVLTSI